MERGEIDARGDGACIKTTIALRLGRLGDGVRRSFVYPQRVSWFRRRWRGLLRR